MARAKIEFSALNWNLMAPGDRRAAYGSVGRATPTCNGAPNAMAKQPNRNYTPGAFTGCAAYPSWLEPSMPSPTSKLRSSAPSWSSRFRQINATGWSLDGSIDHGKSLKSGIDGRRLPKENLTATLHMSENGH
jgi:hypothetical protein